MDAERDMDVAPKRIFRRPFRQIRHVLPILRPGRGNDKPPYPCLPRGGQMHPDGVETSQAGFFSPDELPAPLLPMHPRWLTDALSGDTGLID